MVMQRIRDFFGQAIKKKDLLEVQAEGGTTGVRKAWIESVASGLTPQSLAAVLKDCDDGNIEAFMTLAEEMEERDPHYASVLGQRKRAISGIAPMVVAASEDAKDEEIAEWVRENIAEHDGFADLVEELLDGLGKGFSVVELLWHLDGAAWSFEAFVGRSQRFFQFDKETGRELRLRDDAEPVDGIPLRPFKYAVHKPRLKSGHVFRGGLARLVCFSWMCKAYTLKDWMAFVETYGLPLRLGRYDKAATKQDVAVLFRAVANIGTDAAAVIPRHMDIEFVDNKSGGGTQPIFENLARYVDEQISKAVLGQTMTTDNGSSQAQANVHNEVRHDVAAADARSVAGTINRDIVAPAVLLNFGPVAKMPRIVIPVSEPEDVAVMTEAIARLAEAGVTFKATEARAKVGMSDPDEGDELFGGAKPEETETARSERLALARAGVDLDAIDEIRSEMLGDWEPVMTELLDPFVDAIRDATSYEEAMARLDAIESFPSSRLIDQLVKASFVARAAGDVTDG